jgi:hypothetical protein
MASLDKPILDLLKHKPNLTDRQITDQLIGPGAAPQGINTACRILASHGLLTRRLRHDGLIGNRLPEDAANGAAATEVPQPAGEKHMSSEDRIKAVVGSWLKRQGWQVNVAWGNGHGIDIDARRGKESWIIEAKGTGTTDQSRANSFLQILGEILQRMDSPEARYSIALPSHPQYRRLWQNLPTLAKARIDVTVLWIDENLNIETSR